MWHQVREPRALLGSGFVGVDRPQRDFLEMWRRGMDALGAELPLREALPGRPPTSADKDWLRHTSGPIRVLSSSQVSLRCLNLRLATALGRFVHRS